MRKADSFCRIDCHLVKHVEGENLLKECIKEVLGEMLRDLTYSQDEAPRLTKEVADRVKDRLWPTMLAQWSFWIPVQYLNFRFTPVRHQLNVVLTTSVVWTAFLSYTFPQKEEAPSEEEFEEDLEEEVVDRDALKKNSTSIVDRQKKKTKKNAKKTK